MFRVWLKPFHSFKKLIVERDEPELYNTGLSHHENKIIVDSVDLVIFFESGEETTKIKDLKRYTEKQKKSLVIKS